MNDNVHLIDEAALQELREIMGDDFKLLIDTFIADSKIRLASIRKAILDEDPDALRSAAHSFKGSALNLSAGRLTALCKTLEIMGKEQDLASALDVFNKVEIEYKAVQDYLSQSEVGD